MTKKKYSNAQKRAYWMGYGAGISDGDASEHIDVRQSKGQRKDLCDSMRAGFYDGKKNRRSVPFEVGHRRYPVSLNAYRKTK